MDYFRLPMLPPIHLGSAILKEQDFKDSGALYQIFEKDGSISDSLTEVMETVGEIGEGFVVFQLPTVDLACDGEVLDLGSEFASSEKHQILVQTCDQMTEHNGLACDWKRTVSHGPDQASVRLVHTVRDMETEARDAVRVSFTYQGDAWSVSYNRTQARVSDILLFERARKASAYILSGTRVMEHAQAEDTLDRTRTNALQALAQTADACKNVFMVAPPAPLPGESRDEFLSGMAVYLRNFGFTEKAIGHVQNDLIPAEAMQTNRWTFRAEFDGSWRTDNVSISSSDFRSDAPPVPMIPTDLAGFTRQTMATAEVFRPLINAELPRIAKLIERFAKMP